MDARRKQLKEMSDLVGKLEERDTEQQAFVQLITLLPKLSSSQAYEMYSRLERNKDPIRLSTRENIVLLMAALCKEHPNASARFLKKMVAYLNYRLRDKRQRVTDACVKAAASISLYVLPSLSLISINVLIQPFLKETTVMSDGAAKCIAAMLYPSKDVPLVDHAGRIQPYLLTFFPHLLSRFHSAIHATYSPIFYILTDIVRLAKETNKDLQDLCANSFNEMLSAVDAVLQFGHRSDWLNRKRGVDLIVACLQCFPDRTPFHMASLNRIAEKGRSDFASPVRESAATLMALLAPFEVAEPEVFTAQVYAEAHPHAAPSPKAQVLTPQVSPKRKKMPSHRDSITFKQLLADERIAIRSPRNVVVDQKIEGNQEVDTTGDYEENVKIAMEEGNMELALRIALLSEDKTLLRHWLTFSQPSVQYFRDTTVNALCATFLDYLENPDDAALIFPWISCLLRDETHLEHVDPRVSRHMETLLAELSTLPTKEGLIAARLHHELESVPER
ncbi:unnamed protein product [Aphanomyces euteiches]